MSSESKSNETNWCIILHAVQKMLFNKIISDLMITEWESTAIKSFMMPQLLRRNWYGRIEFYLMIFVSISAIIHAFIIS